MSVYERLGRPTGFVDAMVKSFRPSMENILANAAELDWRSTATAHHEAVLEAVWRDMLQLLPTLSNRQRAELVGQLKRAAIFAPSEVLSICEWLIEHPDAPKDELLIQWGLEDTSEKLTDTLTDVVALIATHPDFTKRSATMTLPVAGFSTENLSASSSDDQRYRVTSARLETAMSSSFRPCASRTTRASAAGDAETPGSRPTVP